MEFCLVFVRKSSSENPDYSLLGLNGVDNLKILSDYKLRSGQPIVCVISNHKILGLYCVGMNGSLNQFYGSSDFLINAETLSDMTFKYVKNYNTIKYILLSCFKVLSSDEILNHINILKDVEEKIISNLILSEVTWDNLKRNISKEIRKTNLQSSTITRLLAGLNKCAVPNKAQMMKKIDIDLDGYDIKIIS